MTICMKRQSLFSGKSKKNITKYCVLIFFTQNETNTPEHLYNMGRYSTVVETIHMWTDNRFPASILLKSISDRFLSDSITKTYLYNFDPLKPHFYLVKMGFTGVYIIFLISAQKHRLWVLVRTASSRRF